MRYNVKSIKYADGSEKVQVFGYTVGHDKSHPLPLDRSPFDGEYIYVALPGSAPGMWDKPSAPRQPVTDPAEIERHRKSAMLRAKKKVEAIGRSNLWKYFFTLTFDDNKVNGYSYDECVKAIQNWLIVQRRKYPGIQYLLVFEPHPTSGRYHVHGLAAGCEWQLRKAKGKRGIYNLLESDYSLGFTTVSMVRDSGAASNYLSKYIMKTLEIIPLGRKRYWASRNLITLEDITLYYLFDQKSLDFQAFVNSLYQEADHISWVINPANDKQIGYFDFYGKGACG